MGCASFSHCRSGESYTVTIYNMHVQYIVHSHTMFHDDFSLLIRAAAVDSTEGHL